MPCWSALVSTLSATDSGFGLLTTRRRASLQDTSGRAVPSFEADFTPCVEIGWRLSTQFWNRGLATEGAASVLI